MLKPRFSCFFSSWNFLSFGFHIQVNKLSPHHPRICNDFYQFPWYQLIVEILGQAGGTCSVSGVGKKGAGKSYPSATCKKGKNSLPDFIRISYKLKDGEYKNGMEFSLNPGHTSTWEVLHEESGNSMVRRIMASNKDELTQKWMSTWYDLQSRLFP